MLRTALVALLFASPAFCPGFSGKRSGICRLRPNEVHFDVKTDKKQHPTAQPDTGKALVYVIGDTWYDHAIHIGTPPTRFGVDGTWVGANGYKSYFFFPVEPGSHRLCTNVQSKHVGPIQSFTAATSFTAEAGKTYYFRTRTSEKEVSNLVELKLVPVDPAEAQVLIAAAAFSTFHLKK